MRVHLGCLDPLLHGTAAGILEHVEAAFEHGASVVSLLRAGLAPEQLPVSGAGVSLCKIRALMHDTCNVTR